MFRFRLSTSTARKRACGICRVERIELRVMLHGAGEEATFPLRIDAGSKVDVVASDGTTTWLADEHFVRGKASRGSHRLDVANSDDDVLLRSVRQGKRFAYAIPLSTGTYEVTLHFQDPKSKRAGKRVFDVLAEDAVALSDVDIVSEAGRATALTKTFSVSVVDGALDLGFQRSKRSAIVSAIEVREDDSVGGGTPPPVVNQPPATTQTIDWGTGASLPVGLSEINPLVFNDQLYVFGGYDNAATYTSTNQVYRYDPAGNTWTRMADMPERLSHIAHVADDRYGYIAGGYVTTAQDRQVFASRNVYRYDPQANAYATLPPLPEARGAGGLGLIGRELHFVAGVDAEQRSHTDHWILNLDNTAAGWQARPDVPEGINHFGVVSTGSAIYLVGGQTGHDAAPNDVQTLYRWTDAQGWTRLRDLPAKRSHSGGATFVHDGRIYTMGGFGPGLVVHSDVFVYDLTTDTWATATPLPDVRHSGAAVAIGGRFYYVAGWKHGPIPEQLASQLWIGTPG